jgi:signal peptidase I
MPSGKEGRLAEKAQRAEKPAGDSLWETVKVILQALVIAFVIRTFFFQPFNIPSGSMIPTLLVGDYLFVNKLAYGYSKYSFDFRVRLFGRDLFHFGPVPIEGRIWAAPPRRGDVVVFKLPSDPKTDYIKRIIGLPGDRIMVKGGVVHINGKPVRRERVADYVVPDGPDAGRRIRRYRETLPNGVSYYVLDLYDGSIADDTEEYVVPPGHYFMMGDNRDNSTDSRFLEQVGYVPYENLVGRAVIIFFSHTPEMQLTRPWSWPFEIRWRRIGSMVR